MRRSEQINEIAAALAKAQGQIEGALKDSSNPAHDKKYADLASVWGACRVPLSENGIAVIQTPENFQIKERKHIEVQKWDKYAKKEYKVTEEWIDATLTVTTTLAHTSGQWIESDLEVLVSRPDAQGQGSAITYGRRYSLAAMVGIYQEDDDGNKASNIDPDPTGAQEGKKQDPPDKKTDKKDPPEKPAPKDDKKQDPPAKQIPPHIQGIMDKSAALKMEKDDLVYLMKEVVASDTFVGLVPEQFRKLATTLAGMIDEKIAFATWKETIEKDKATLAASIAENNVPGFPGEEG